MDALFVEGSDFENVLVEYSTQYNIFEYPSLDTQLLVNFIHALLLQHLYML